MGWRNRSWADEPQGGWAGGIGLRHGPLFVTMGVLVGIHMLGIVLAFPAPGLVDGVYDQLAISRDGLLSGKLWQPLTYQLLHGGAMHIFWNLLMFFIWGRLAMGVFGARRFLTTIVVCGAVGGLLDRFMPWTQSFHTVVGFSGALNAMYGLLLIAVPNLQLNILGHAVKLKWLIIIFVGLDAMRLAETRGMTGVALGTHLWSFAVACLWLRFLEPRVMPWWEGRAAAKERKVQVRAAASEAKDEAELDRILQKINEQGMAALNDRERAFLKSRAQKSKSGGR